MKKLCIICLLFIATVVIGQEEISDNSKVIVNNYLENDFLSIIMPVVSLLSAFIVGAYGFRGIKKQIKYDTKKYYNQKQQEKIDFLKQKLEIISLNIRNIQTSKKQLITYVEHKDNGHEFLNSSTGEMIYNFNNFSVIYSLFFQDLITIEKDLIGKLENYVIFKITKIVKDIKDEQADYKNNNNQCVDGFEVSDPKIYIKRINDEDEDGNDYLDIIKNKIDLYMESLNDTQQKFNNLTQ